MNLLRTVQLLSIITFTACQSSPETTVSTMESIPSSSDTSSFYTYVSSWDETGEGAGIGIYEWFPGSGELKSRGEVTEVARSSYLALDSPRARLYSINNDSIHAFSIDSNTGNLTLLNKIPVSGRDGCHLSISNDGKYLLAAYYSSGSAASYEILENGALGAQMDQVQHSGSSINLERQEAAHAHMILPAPTGLLIFVPDLGMDKVMAYQLNSAGSFSPASPAYAELEPGFGPRHLVFHPHKPYAYVLAELTSHVVGFAFDSYLGLTKKINTVSMLPPDFKDFSKAADIHITPDGRFLYASNRGHDSIAIMSIDQETGELTLVDIVPGGGSWPRAFEVDPSGKYLLVANKRSNAISIQKIDSELGVPEEDGNVNTVASPQCIRFLKRG